MTMMSSTNFNMGTILNKLRSIEEDAQLNELDPGMETSGKEIDQGSFTRTMSRLAAIKDAVGEDHYNDLKAGVRAMYMNRRPNLNQMTALMDLLETVLAYVAEDNSLFQRLKTDLNKDAEAADQAQEPTGEPAPEIGAPTTAEPGQQEPQGSLRGLK
jgi:hypothetical protein